MVSRKHVRFFVVWATLLLLTTARLNAQRYTFRQYGSREGLNNLSLLALLQDKTGYIWVGTENGLFRYDADRFRRYGTSDGLPGSEILGLAESKDGILWVATHSGLARFDGKKFNTVDTGEQGWVDAIAFDSMGRVYLEQAAGVSRGVADQNGRYEFHTLLRGTIRALCVGKRETWIGYEDDLWHLVGDKPEALGSKAGLPRDRWSAIAEDASGNLWVQSASRLYELPQGGSRFVDRSAGIPSSSLPHLYADNRGRLYVSSDSGVTVIDGTNQTQIDSQRGLPADVIGPVLVDRDESLWIGAYGGGLIRRLGHGEWLSWRKEDGLLGNSVWPIIQDRLGQIWVGTTSGLNILDAKRKPVRAYSRENGLAGNWVTALAEDAAGDIYAGLDAGSISRFDHKGKLLRTYDSNSGMSGEHVLKLLVDKQRRLWVGTTEACFRSRESLASGLEVRFEQVTIPGSSGVTSVQDLAMSEDGVIWLATRHGLVRFDGKNWSTLTTSDGLKAERIEVLALCKDGLWIAYRESLGLTRLQFDGGRTKVTHYTTQDGLSSNEIIAMATAPSGKLWAATDAGIDVLDGTWWRHYGVDDGLIWNDTDANGLFVDTEENAWIGTSQGLSRLSKPEYSAVAAPAPVVVITSIEGPSHEFLSEDHPRLPYSKSSLVIHYSSLNYSSESSARFRYRLSGYEQEWHETRERSVELANLPSGAYVFEIVAAAPNGFWSEKPARFAFSVQPPWWMSWWFLGACLLLALFIGHTLLRLRLRMLMVQREDLEHLVAERTSQLSESHRLLSESKRQLWAAMDAARLGIWRYELQQGKDLKSVSAAFATSDGSITTEELLRYVVAEDRDRFLSILRQEDEERENDDAVLEISARLPEGKLRWLQVRGGIDRESPNKSVVSGILMDVTRQKKAERDLLALEQQLRQAQKVEALGRLAGGIAHDFNNLLMVIQSYSELLQRTMSGNMGVQQNLQQILKAADRGASLTRQLLAFSRKQILAPVVMDMNHAINDALDMLKRLIGEHIELKVTLSDSLWTVKADPTQVALILVNLCVNARDAMPDGGVLQLETKNCTVDEEMTKKYSFIVKGDYIQISITDSGTGISQEVQERMFDPFFTTKGDGKGTGLGLPTVFGIVKQSGGYMLVSSELGKGSCFTIYLPRVIGSVTAAEHSKAATIARGRGTILVAEDEDPLRTVLCDYLESLGYEVIRASSGPDALDKASKRIQEIDLVITDVVMPKMSGRELAEALCQMRPDLRVIFMSGYTEDALVKSVVSDEGVSFLQKPFRLSVLASKVSKVLGAPDSANG
jgi:signal transduction histidine kinase/ligand-binding sensor domain-containing protein/ActR/RegA family two-component response regulator